MSLGIFTLRGSMAASFPNSALAVIDLRKLRDNCLNPEHPRGCHKAAVFREVLGLTRDDAIWPCDAFLVAARAEEAVLVNQDVWGDPWRVDGKMTRHGRTVMVKSLWLVRTGDYLPRFVSGWILR